MPNADEKAGSRRTGRVSHAAVVVAAGAFLLATAAGATTVGLQNSSSETSLEGDSQAAPGKRVAMSAGGEGANRNAVYAPDPVDGPDPPAPPARPSPPPASGGGQGALDTTAPTLKITSKLKKSKSRNVTIKFSAESGAALQCLLDKKVVKPCESPLKLKKLGYGKHTLSVSATDIAGNKASDSLAFKVEKPKKGKKGGGKKGGGKKGGGKKGGGKK